MSQDSFYLKKYLKYKAKYLELINIIGGGKGVCVECAWDEYLDKKDKCKEFKKGESKKICKCGHAESEHKDK